jgi:hypothetical protein
MNMEFGIWLWWGSSVFVALWMGASLLLIIKGIKLREAEWTHLEDSIDRGQSVTLEMKAAVGLKLKQIQLNLMRLLALKVAIHALELQLRSSYLHLSFPFREQLDTLLRNVKEHESIRNMEQLEELLLVHNQSFIEELICENKTLSQQELFMCTLLHAGLNNDELAALTGKSQEALGMAKLRLKRKLKGKPYGWL